MAVSAESVDSVDISLKDLSLLLSILRGRFQKPLGFLVVERPDGLQVFRYEFPHYAARGLQDRPGQTPLPLPDLDQGISVHPLGLHQNIVDPFGGLTPVPAMGIPAGRGSQILQLPQQSLRISYVQRVVFRIRQYISALDHPQVRFKSVSPESPHCLRRFGKAFFIPLFIQIKKYFLDHTMHHYTKTYIGLQSGSRAGGVHILFIFYFNILQSLLNLCTRLTSIIQP